MFSRTREKQSAPPEVIPYEALSADPSSRWSFMAQVLREADEAKVIGCKEDIDTLLVFAGLFSAVMTAFIIETYKLLMQNPTMTVANILGTISTRMSSYTVSDRFANSTHVSATSPTTSLQPSASAIRINSLWFASLICSLVAASLGVLMKQWLREYLDGQSLPPQARARIRHFRYEGLTRWKVFEIAAILPLLLQVALGLFFLGVCFFTQSLNDTVAWTSTPLVIAWAALLSFAILAPAVSARCPYKTTLLKLVLKSLRRIFRHNLAWMHKCVQSSFHRSSRDTASRDLQGGARSWGSIDSDRPPSYRSPELPLKLWQEEEDILSSEGYDIQILLSVDSIKSDDELLGTVIRKSLSQIHGAGTEVLDFVQEVARRRSQSLWAVTYDSSPQDDCLIRRQLTKRCRSALVDIISDTLRHEIQTRLSSSGGPVAQASHTTNSWMHRALKMTIALSGSTMRDSEAVAMTDYLVYDQTTFETVVRTYQRTLPPQHFSLLLDVTQKELDRYKGDTILSFIRHTMRWLAGWTLASDTKLDEILKSVYKLLPPDCLPVLSHIIIVSLEPLFKDATNEPENSGSLPLTFKPWQEDMMAYLVDACDPTATHHSINALDDICEFIARALLRDPWSAAVILEALIRRPAFDWHTRFWMFGLVLKQKVQERNGVPSMLKNLRAAIRQNDVGLNPIGVCIVICNLASYFFTSDDIQLCRTEWQDLFSVLATVVTVGVQMSLEDRVSVAHCLERIDLFDNPDNTAVRAGKTRSTSIVPDNLISMLVKMSVESARVDKLGRVRALRARDGASESPSTTYRATTSEDSMASEDESDHEDPSGQSSYPQEADSSSPSTPSSMWYPAREVSYNDNGWEPNAPYSFTGPPDTHIPYIPPSSQYTLPVMYPVSPPIYAPSMRQDSATLYNTSQQSMVTPPSRQVWSLSPYHNLAIKIWLSSLDANPSRTDEEGITYSRYTRSLRRNGFSCLGDIIRLAPTGQITPAASILQSICGIPLRMALQLARYAYDDSHGLRPFVHGQVLSPLPIRANSALRAPRTPNTLSQHQPLPGGVPAFVAQTINLVEPQLNSSVPKNVAAELGSPSNAGLSKTEAENADVLNTQSPSSMSIDHSDVGPGAQQLAITPKTTSQGLHLVDSFADLQLISPHQVLYDGMGFPTAFHLFQALKFIDSSPDVARRICHCQNVTEVLTIAEQANDLIRPDWSEVVLEKLDEVLHAKFTQHPDLRQLLLSTGTASLIYPNMHDASPRFWGPSSVDLDLQALGEALIRIRQRFMVAE